MGTYYTRYFINDTGDIWIGQAFEASPYLGLGFSFLQPAEQSYEPTPPIGYHRVYDEDTRTQYSTVIKETQTVEFKEAELNNQTSQANLVSLNYAVSGRLSSVGDVDNYFFAVHEPGEITLKFRLDPSADTSPTSSYSYGDIDYRFKLKLMHDYNGDGLLQYDEIYLEKNINESAVETLNVNAFGDFYLQIEKGVFHTSAEYRFIVEGDIPAMTYSIPEGGRGWINHEGKGVTINAPNDVVTFNDGIGVTNTGTGSITINASKLIYGGFGVTDSSQDIDGIYAWNKGPETKDVILNVADVIGYTDAIWIDNSGTGDVIINSSGSITGGRNNSTETTLMKGIVVENKELSSNVKIDVKDVTGGNHDVIYVENLGMGSTTIDVRGTIVSNNVFAENAQGIDVWGAESSVTVHSTASVTGEEEGISLTKNNDTLIISGSVYGKNGTAVNLYKGNDIVTITGSATINGTIDGHDGNDTANLMFARTEIENLVYTPQYFENIQFSYNDKSFDFKSIESFKFADGKILTPSELSEAFIASENLTIPTPEPVSQPEPTPAPSYPEPTGINKILVEKYGYEWVNGKAWKPGTAPEPEAVEEPEPTPAPAPEPEQPAPSPEPISPETGTNPTDEVASLKEKIEQLQASLAALQEKYEAALVRISELEGKNNTTNPGDAVNLPESPAASPETEPSTGHPLSDNFLITSSFGTSINEGSVSDPNGGSGKEISFTITQTDPQIKSVYAVIVPVTGQTSDFWDNFWSNKIGGEPADQFALGSFENVENSNATISFTINADSEIEEDETFNLNVYEKNTDLPLGNEPIKTFTFKIIDDDVNTSAPEPTLTPPPTPEPIPEPAPSYPEPTGINKILVEKYGYEWVNGKAWKPGTAPEAMPATAAPQTPEPTNSQTAKLFTGEYNTPINFGAVEKYDDGSLIVSTKDQTEAISYLGSEMLEQSITSVPKTGDDFIDGLLEPNSLGTGSTKWGDADLSNTRISFSFIDSDSKFDVIDYNWVESGKDVLDNPIIELTWSQKGYVRSALKEWSDVANIEFVEVQETGTDVGTIRFGGTSFTDDPDTVGWTWGSPETSNYPSTADIWLTPATMEVSDWAPGTYEYQTLIHEIGHAIGLGHPHDGYPFPDGYDLTKYTLMSYEQYNYDLYETSPMVYDIAAIQHLYGANETTNSSNTIYKFDSGIGASDVGPMLDTIWDSGGIDILDMGEILNSCDINLNGGEYSKIGYSNWINDYDLGIAFGTVIENVNGGKAADIIRGNEFSNQIDGGGGDDIIYGDDGSDIFVCSSGGGVDVIKDFNVSEDLVAFLEYGQTFTKNYSHSEDAQGNLVVSMLDGSGSLILENIAFGTELIIA